VFYVLTTGFWIRFLDDFDPSYDDWRPSEGEVIMNAMEVPEGTYEVCVKTVGAAPNDARSNPKWIMNIMWQMEGLDINVDTNMGKQLALLSTTLTSLARERQDADDQPDEEIITTLPATTVTDVAATAAGVDPKVRTRIIEQEMNEQAKAVEGLRQRGAAHGTIVSEEKRLHELKGAVLHNYREGLLNRLKRQSVAATVISLGASGTKSRHSRAHSMVGVGTLPRSSAEAAATSSATTLSSEVQMRRNRHQRTQSFDLQNYTAPASGLQRPDNRLPAIGRDGDMETSSSSSLSDDDDEDFVDARPPVARLLFYCYYYYSIS
jgi:hypothetical protein